MTTSIYNFSFLTNDMSLESSQNCETFGFRIAREPDYIFFGTIWLVINVSGLTTLYFVEIMLTLTCILGVTSYRSGLWSHKSVWTQIYQNMETQCQKEIFIGDTNFDYFSLFCLKNTIDTGLDIWLFYITLKMLVQVPVTYILETMNYDLSKWDKIWKYLFLKENGVTNFKFSITVLNRKITDWLNFFLWCQGNMSDF